MLAPDLSPASYLGSSQQLGPRVLPLPREWGEAPFNQRRVRPGEGAQLWALDSPGLGGGSTSHCPLHCLISKYLRYILVRFLIHLSNLISL